MMLQKSERKSPKSSRKFMLINYSESFNLHWDQSSMMLRRLFEKSFIKKLFSSASLLEKLFSIKASERHH